MCGPMFTLVMRANLIYLGSMGHIIFMVKTLGRLNLKCIKKSGNGGGGSVMVWGMFSAAGHTLFIVFIFFGPYFVKHAS